MNQPWSFTRRHWQSMCRTIAVVFFFVGQLGACTFASSGQVTDEESGKPLPDVFVIATWTSSSGPFFVQSSTLCFNLEIAQTDKQGRYSVSDFSWNFNPLYLGRTRDVDFYLQGYENSPNRNRYDENNMVLRRNRGDAIKRLERLASRMDDRCVPEWQTKRKLGALYEAILQEAAEIAKSPEELAVARWIRDRKDTIGLPFGSPQNPEGSIRK